jgi:hypothetical protein
MAAQVAGSLALPLSLREHGRKKTLVETACLLQLQAPCFRLPAVRTLASSRSALRCLFCVLERHLFSELRC